MKCFYHRADLDGKCSAAIVRRWCPDVELIGVDYGDVFPWERIVPGDEVIMVDFSLPMPEMQRLSDLCRLTWIDHHKSALEAARACGFVASGGQYCVVGNAACELAWEVFFGRFGVVMPRAVRLLGRYDVWDHESHPGALEFQYGMRQLDAWPDDAGFWQLVFEHDSEVNRLIEEGALLLAYERRQNAAYARSCAFDVVFSGLRCVAINRGLSNSLLFEGVYDPQRHDAMLAFVRRAGHWKVSLYTDRPGVDVSAVAAAHGGGGHAGAAGFECERLPFFEG